MKCPSEMQKSSVNGSQRISGVGVKVTGGVAGGVVVAEGESAVGVAMICVFTATTGVCVTPVAVQDVRITKRKILSIGFISRFDNTRQRSFRYPMGTISAR